jgi:DNA-binding transcriptional ArsR family regulator
MSSFNDTLYLSSNGDIMILRRDIFQAIADPTRRAILLLLASSQTVTAGVIADNFDAARSTISKHIQILTECGLVEATQQGREIHYHIKMEEMKEVDVWLDQLRQVWEARFDRLDLYLEKLQKTKR